jgi:hypothetical protein
MSCDVENSGHLDINKTEITQRQSEQTKIFKISHYIISKVYKNEMIKMIGVRCTLTIVVTMTMAGSEGK